MPAHIRKVLKKLKKELLRLSSELVASLSLENDIVISRAFVTKAQYDKLQIPFLMNVRREGVAV